MSAVAIIGTALSIGCRKLGITPARAGATSHREFSMNQAARRNAIGKGSVERPASTRPELVEQIRLGRLRADRRQATIFGGRAASSAARSVAMMARTSGKPGDGSNIGGIRMKTPSTPVKALRQCLAVSKIGLYDFAALAAQSLARSGLRTTARTFWPISIRLFAAALSDLTGYSCNGIHGDSPAWIWMCAI